MTRIEAINLRWSGRETVADAIAAVQRRARVEITFRRVSTMRCLAGCTRTRMTPRWKRWMKPAPGCWPGAFV